MGKRTRGTRAFKGLVWGLTIFLSALLGLALSQPANADDAPSGPVPTAEDFCRAWNEVQAAQASGSQAGVDSGTGMHVSAPTVNLVGADCHSEDARIEFIGATVTDSAPDSGTASATGSSLAQGDGTAHGTYLRGTGGSAEQAVGAATSGAGLYQGQEVFVGAQLYHLNIAWYYDNPETPGTDSGWKLYGDLVLRFSGGTTTVVQYGGWIYDQNNWSIGVESPPAGTSLPNIAGVLHFAGKLKKTAGVVSLELGADSSHLGIAGANPLDVYDLHFALNASQALGIQLSATGAVEVGGSRIAGALHFASATSGVTSIDGSGAVDINVAASGSAPGGRLTGSATFAYTPAAGLTMSFSGEAEVAGRLITSVSASLDKNAAQLSGQVDITDVGAAAVSGAFYYGDDLAGRTLADKAGSQVQVQKGDGRLEASLATLNLKGLALSGSLVIGRVGGQGWVSGGGAVDVTPGNGSHLGGNLSFDWPAGGAMTVSVGGTLDVGSFHLTEASLSLDGQAASFDARLAVSGAFDTRASGVWFYGDDLSGRTIVDRSGQTVPAAKGDVRFEGSANLTFPTFSTGASFVLGRAGGVVGMGVGADLQVGRTAVKFSGDMASDGSASLAAAASVDFNGWTADFSARLDKTASSMTSTGSVAVGGSSVAGPLQLAVANGSVTSLSGSGPVDIRVPASGSAPGGRLTGPTSFAYTPAAGLSMSFSGEAEIGGRLITSVSASLDKNAAQLSGQVDITDVGKVGVSGTFYYGDDLAGRTLANKAGTQTQVNKGDGRLAANAALKVKGLALNGSLVIGRVGGQAWVSGGGAVDVTPGAGSHLVGQLTFDWPAGGTLTVSLNGALDVGTFHLTEASLSLDGQAASFNARLVVDGTTDLRASGTWFYGDNLSGRTIVNRSGQTVPAVKGDVRFEGSANLKFPTFSTNAAFVLSRSADQVWLRAGANIQIARTTLLFSGDIGSNGTGTLQGAGTVNFDGWSVGFSGRIDKTATSMSISGGGYLQFGLVQIFVSGSLAKPSLTDTTYTFTGTGGLKFAGYTITAATFTLKFGDGLRTTFGIRLCFILCSSANYQAYYEVAGNTRVTDVDYWTNPLLVGTYGPIASNGCSWLCIPDYRGW